jgi:hypothetical protein
MWPLTAKRGSRAGPLHDLFTSTLDDDIHSGKPVPAIPFRISILARTSSLPFPSPDSFDFSLSLPPSLLAHSRPDDDALLFARHSAPEPRPIAQFNDVGVGGGGRGDWHKLESKHSTSYSIVPTSSPLDGMRWAEKDLRPDDRLLGSRCVVLSTPRLTTAPLALSLELDRERAGPHGR